MTTGTVATKIASILQNDTIFAMADSTPHNTMTEVVEYWKTHYKDITDEVFGAPASTVIKMWDNGELNECIINDMIAMHRTDQKKSHDAFWA